MKSKIDENQNQESRNYGSTIPSRQNHKERQSTSNNKLHQGVKVFSDNKANVSGKKISHLNKTINTNRENYKSPKSSNYPQYQTNTSSTNKVNRLAVDPGTRSNNHGKQNQSSASTKNLKWGRKNSDQKSGKPTHHRIVSDFSDFDIMGGKVNHQNLNAAEDRSAGKQGTGGKHKQTKSLAFQYQNYTPEVKSASKKDTLVDVNSLDHSKFNMNYLVKGTNQYEQKRNIDEELKAEYLNIGKLNYQALQEKEAVDKKRKGSDEARQGFHATSNHLDPQYKGMSNAEHYGKEAEHQLSNKKTSGQSQTKQNKPIKTDYFSPYTTEDPKTGFMMPSHHFNPENRGYNVVGVDGGKVGDANNMEFELEVSDEND